MSISIPREWASSELYTGGSAIGTDTKEDPGVAISAEGFVPGRAGAQHVNYVLNQLTKTPKRQLGIANLRLREMRLSGTTIDDTGNSMAAWHGSHPNARGLNTLALKCNSTGILKTYDCDYHSLAGTLVSITSLVTDVADDRQSSPRIVAVGTGGNNNCFSVDQGQTWTAGGAIGGVPQSIVYDEVNSRFLCNRSTGALVHFSTDATSWSSASTSLDSTQSGMAVLSSGRVIVCGIDGGLFPKFSKSTNGGTSWSDTTGTVDVASLTPENAGWVAGNGGDTIWHVFAFFGGTKLRLSASTDGDTWTTVRDITLDDDGFPFAAAIPDDKVRLLVCQNTGLMVILCPNTDNAVNTLAIASTDEGLTWSSPMVFPGTTMAAFGIANGKLFFTRGAQVFQSDGIDWP
jgi:hypothetical protein